MDIYAQYLPDSQRRAAAKMMAMADERTGSIFGERKEAMGSKWKQDGRMSRAKLLETWWSSVGIESTTSWTM